MVSFVLHNLYFGGKICESLISSPPYASKVYRKSSILLFYTRKVIFTIRVINKSPATPLQMNTPQIKALVNPFGCAYTSNVSALIKGVVSMFELAIHNAFIQNE